MLGKKDTVAIITRMHVSPISMYRGANKGMDVLLSRTQAGPGRTVKQEQEEISRNHVQAFIPGSVYPITFAYM